MAEQTTTELETANAVLRSFARETRIVADPRGWRVEWTSYHAPPRTESRRWQVSSGQDFYPIWHHEWPHGGTACTAMSQLVRWLQGRPVLPAASWRYWASETCGLLPAGSVDVLLSGGYPEHATCVLCGERPSGLDWWHLKGVSGPCCSWTKGCRQKPRVLEVQHG